MKLRKRIMALALGILGSVTVLGTAAFAATESQAPTGAVADTAAESSAVEESSTAAEETDASKEEKSEAETSGQGESEGTDKEESPAIVRHNAKLTVKAFEDWEKQDKPVQKDNKGVGISLYKIASIEDDGSYSVVEGELGDALSKAGFETITADDINDTDQNQKIRKALDDYLNKKGTKASAEFFKATDPKTGSVTFDISEKELGLYYLQGDIIENYFDGSVDGREGKLSYIPTTSLVSLPMYVTPEKGTDYWDYIPTVNVKYREGGVWIDPPVLKVIKGIKDLSIPEREFTFVMEAIDGAPLPEADPDEGIEKVEKSGSTEAYLKMKFPSAKAEITDKNSKTVRTGSKKEFGEVWYEEPGLYEYYIREVPESTEAFKDFTFDQALYKLHVNVTLDEDRVLKGVQWYEKYPDGKDPNPGPSKEIKVPENAYPVGESTESEFQPFEITNIYDHDTWDPDDDNNKLKVYAFKKVNVTNRAIEGSLRFDFLLGAEDGNPEDGSSLTGNDKLRTYVDIDQRTAANGVFTFFEKGISFRKPGTYKFRAKEVQGSNSYVTYDNTEYEIEVVVDDDLQYTGKVNVYIDGKLDPEKGWKWKDNTIRLDFTNIYTRKGGGGGGGGNKKHHTGGDPLPTTTPAPETEPEVIPGMLPKTGMLWWPVPILAVAGIFLLAAGFILERRRS